MKVDNCSQEPHHWIYCGPVK